LFIRWLLSLCIYGFFFWLNLTVDFYSPTIYFTVFIFFTIFSIFVAWMKVRGRLNKEKEISKGALELSHYKLIVSTVFKNEGQTVVDTVKEYLNFKNPPKVVFYDDHSDDGSFEALKPIEEANAQQCIIKRLERTKKILHPKGMGFEDLINSYDGDYYMILDADTLVKEKELEKALHIMRQSNLKVLHFTRRNDLSNDLANHIGDTEEISSTINKVLGIFPWYFNGSGFIIRADAAKQMAYDAYSPSDDSQIGLFLRKNKIKVFDTLSLFAHEKAPKTIGKLMKQHSAWTKGGIHHYLEKEKFTIFPAALISAYMLFALFNPLQLYNILMPVAFFFLLEVNFISNRIVAERSIILSLRNAFCHSLVFFFKGTFIVAYHIVTFPFKRFSFWFSKTQY